MGLVGSILGVGVGVGVGVPPTAPTGSPIAVGVGEGLTDGFGAGIETPLFQMSFLPLFMHVYFLPAYVEVCPALLQLAPALIAAVAFSGATRANIRVSVSRIFFIGKVSRVIYGNAKTRPDK